MSSAELNAPSASALTPESQAYLDDLTRFLGKEEGATDSWVREFRQAGLRRFAELGLPAADQEEWRHASVAELTKQPFRPTPRPGAGSVEPSELSGAPFWGLAPYRMVFVDGQLAPGLSGPTKPPAGLKLGSLAEALRLDQACARLQALGRAGHEESAFAALNTACFSDGAFVHVSRETSVDAPLHLLFITTCQGPDTARCPRNLIVVEEGGALTLVESYLGAGQAAGLTNAVTEIVAGAGATVEHCKLQQERAGQLHVGDLRLVLGRGCAVSSHSVALGAKVFRQRISATFGGQNSNCVLNGLYLAEGSQNMDYRMVVEHAQPGCASHEYFHGVLTGRARGMFHGRIVVRPQAQKTDAKQTSRSLLLSEEASVNSQPQLEIYADDVKCTHGATVGRLSDEAIFYLRSRGIGLAEARRLLIQAFASEISERVKYPTVRDELSRLVWRRLEEGPFVAGGN